MVDYDQEAARLERRYREAVGEAIALGVKVYRDEDPAQMKSLGELEDEIAVAEGRTPPSVFLGHLAAALEWRGR